MGNYEAALGCLLAEQPIWPLLPMAEWHYVLALCYMELQTRDGVTQAIDILLALRERLISEFEIRLRAQMLLQQAYVLLPDTERARQVEREVLSDLSQRAMYDPAALDKIHVTHRRACSIHSPEISERRILRAVKYFSANGGMAGLRELYRSLTNLAGVRILLGRWRESLDAAEQAEALIMSSEAVRFPRKDVLANNLTLAAFRAGACDAAEAIRRQQIVIDSTDGQMDSFIQRCNLAGYHLLVGNHHNSCSILEELYEQMALKDYSEVYLKYYCWSLLAVARIAMGDIKGCQAVSVLLTNLLANERCGLERAVAFRHNLFVDLVVNGPDAFRGPLFTNDTVFIDKHSGRFGGSWSHYGRLVALCELQFWSDS